MEHDAHLSENVDQAGSGAKIVTLLVLVAVAAGAIVYFFFMR